MDVFPVAKMPRVLLICAVPLRALVIMTAWSLVIQTTRTTHLCNVCTCSPNTYGPIYLVASCEISSPGFFSYFTSVTDFPTEDYQLELLSNVSANQLVSVPEGTFASFSNSSPVSLGLYGFFNLAPIPSGAFQGLRLQRVYLAGLGLDSLPVGALREQSAFLTGLDVFDVLTNNGSAISPPRFHSFEAIQTISIANTPLTDLRNSFSNLPALVHLRVSNALLEDEGFSPTVFNDVPRLESLKLSGNCLTEIPAVLTDLRSLKRLDLSRNKIDCLDAGVLNGLRGLKELALVGNRIEMVDAEAVEALRNLTSLEVLRLGGANPFACTCGLLPFLRWLHQSRARIGQGSDFAALSCQDPAHLGGAKLLSPDLVSYLETACSENATASPGPPAVSATAEHDGGDTASPSYRIVVPAVAVSLALSVAGAASTWMMHRKLRRRWVGLFRRFDPGTPSGHALRRQATEHRYDAYVCHHESVTGFVVNEMLPELEGDGGGDGFRLCLSFRDFLVGADKLDNVASAIRASRVVVVLLNAEFVACGQCMLELNMACTRALEGEGSLGFVPAAGAESHRGAGLLLVLLDALPVDALPTALRVLRDKITCLTWKTEDAARCWQQLKSSLRNTTDNSNRQLEDVFDITQPLV